MILRVVLAALALILASCQGGGLDSGMGGMGGGMEPPVSQPGSMNGGGIGGPKQWQRDVRTRWPVRTSAATGKKNSRILARRSRPIEAQYAIAQGPTGMKCPQVLQYNQPYNCNVAFNIPTPSPAPSGRRKEYAAADREPDADAAAKCSSDDDSDDSDDTPAPTPSPGGNDHAGDRAAAKRRALDDQSRTRC